MKRALKSIPYFLAGAIVLVLLAGTIAFSASRMLYGNKALSKIKVGVVLPEEDRLSRMAVDMISSLDSVEGLCEFIYMDEDEGRQGLKNGQVFALMVVPQGLIQGIMDGTNLPVTVIFPRQAGLEAAVFRELTEAGTAMLSSSQAAIYAVDDFLRSNGLEAAIPQAELDLNNLYLKYALNRASLFGREEVSASGDVPVLTFYVISASVLVLLLLGIPAATILKPYGRAMEQKLALIGIGRVQRTAVRTLTMALCLLAVSAPPFFFCLYKGWLEAGPVSILMWILVCVAVAGWILFIYELCGSTVAGILSLFLSTCVMMFLSGGIIPSAFLPQTMESLSRWLPTTFLMDGVKWMVRGDGLLPVMKLLIMEGAVFALSALVRRDYE